MQPAASASLTLRARASSSRVRTRSAWRRNCPCSIHQAKAFSNNDGVVSVPWKYMTAIRQGKKRFKHTLGYSFRRSGYSSDIDYPAEYVSGDVAKAVSGTQSGAIPTFEIPAQTATALKHTRPHDNSPIGMLARMQGIPEYRLACSVCGKSAGFCHATGDELSDACGGCERSFTGITTA